MTRSRIKNTFTEILRKKISDINTINTVNLNISNLINILDIQILQKENNRVYSDWIQTLDLQVYRVVSNTKSQEFDLCAETVFETALTELRKQNDKKWFYTHVWYSWTFEEKLILRNNGTQISIGYDF